MAAGIDYGMGQTNIDLETGVRYGIISQNSVMSEALDDVYQGDDLGYEAFKTEVIEELREAIKRVASNNGGDEDAADQLDVDDIFDELNFNENYEGSGPYAYTSEEGYSLQTTGDNDLFVFRSPYYTTVQFCSPCVPGAGNLDCPHDLGVETYCLGEDWFDEHRPCPYRIFKMENRSKHHRLIEAAQEAGALSKDDILEGFVPADKRDQYEDAIDGAFILRLLFDANPTEENYKAMVDTIHEMGVRKVFRKRNNLKH